MMGTPLSLLGLETPQKAGAPQEPRPPVQQVLVSSHRAAQEGVSKGMCRKTSAILHLKATSFLWDAVLGCS